MYAFTFDKCSSLHTTRVLFVALLFSVTGMSLSSLASVKKKLPNDIVIGYVQNQIQVGKKTILITLDRACQFC
jgi:hypothetical protein